MGNSTRMPVQCMRIAALLSIALIAMPAVGGAQWTVETLRDDLTGREFSRAKLPEFGGRATLVIRCLRQDADAVVYLHQPVTSAHLPLMYRFDDDQAESRIATVSQDGHLLQIWNDEEKQHFARAKRLRVQTRPFVVFDFDLRGTETILPKIKC